MSTNRQSPHVAATAVCRDADQSNKPLSSSDALHNRLLSGDRTALEELAEILLPSLCRQLRRAFPRSAHDIINDAVVDAIIGYGRDPSTFDPFRGPSLERFLYHVSWRNMADLLKAGARRLARETEYARQVTDQNRDTHIGGNTAFNASDGQSTWRLADAAGVVGRERAALRCWLDGETRTAPLAAALGAAGLTPSEQRREVKRFKDRVLKRLARVRARLKGTGSVLQKMCFEAEVEPSHSASKYKA
jgi:RNA polymerase sigma-70 factor, ECF subfamily